MRSSERRLDALPHNTHDVITVVDDADRAVFVSSAVTSLLGHDDGDTRGRRFIVLAHLDDDHPAQAVRNARRREYQAKLSGRG